MTTRIFPSQKRKGEINFDCNISDSNLVVGGPYTVGSDNKKMKFSNIRSQDLVTQPTQVIPLNKVVLGTGTNQLKSSVNVTIDASDSLSGVGNLFATKVNTSQISSLNFLADPLTVRTNGGVIFYAPTITCTGNLSVTAGGSIITTNALLVNAGSTLNAGVIVNGGLTTNGNSSFSSPLVVNGGVYNNFTVNGGTVLNTALMGGNIFSYTGSGWISSVNRANASSVVVVQGVFNSSGELQPTVGAHTSALSAWATLWINPGSNIIMGNSLSATSQINSNKLYVVGNLECTGVLRCNSLLVNGSSVLITPVYLNMYDTTTETYTFGINQYPTFSTVTLNAGFTITNSSTWVVNSIGKYAFDLNYSNLSGVTDLRFVLLVNGVAVVNESSAQYGSAITNFHNAFLVSLNASDVLRFQFFCNTTNVVNTTNSGFPIRKLRILKIA